MKKFLSLVAVFVVSFSSLHASDNDYGISVNGGRSNHIDIYRIGIQKPFNASVYDFESVTLHGFHEVGLNYWVGERNNVHAISYSPIFKLLFNSFQANEYQPYIDFGIGVALVSDTKIDNRNLSSSFLFEDRISVGISKDAWDFYIRYMHYSNAGIQSPNEGIDIVLAGINYNF